MYGRYIKVYNNNNKYYDGVVNFKQSVYEFDVDTRWEVVEKRCGTIKRGIRERDFKAPTGCPTCANLPVLKNWADEGKVAPVQDQGLCRSSYLFASVACLESLVAIRSTSSPIKLSEQQLLECIRDPEQPSPNGGCHDGKVEWIWETAKSKSGIVASASYKPYSANDTGTCSSKLPKSPNTKIDSWIKVPVGDEEALKFHLATKGPITVSMDFFSTITNYKSGIFDDPYANCNVSMELKDGFYRMAKPYNHALLLVGNKIFLKFTSVNFFIVSKGRLWNRNR